MDWLIGVIRVFGYFQLESPGYQDWISSGEKAREWGMREITSDVQYIDRTVCSRELRKRLIW